MLEQAWVFHCSVQTDDKLDTNQAQSAVDRRSGRASVSYENEDGKQGHRLHVRDMTSRRRCGDASLLMPIVGKYGWIGQECHANPVAMPSAETAVQICADATCMSEYCVATSVSFF